MHSEVKIVEKRGMLHDKGHIVDVHRKVGCLANQLNHIEDGCVEQLTCKKATSEAPNG